MSGFVPFGTAKLSTDPAPVVEEVAAPTQDNQFARGYRSGLSGAYSQINSAAGLLGEASGNQEFADARYAAARAARLEAEANAPRVNSYKQIGNLRDAFDYGAGIAGGLIPSVGMGIAGGIGGAILTRGRGGALAGSSLAMVPQETGDIVQRQQADPVASAQPADVRAKQALTGGAISAAGQGIVPGMLGAGIAGVGTGFRSLAGSMLTEGLAEAGGEAVKQGTIIHANPTKAYDTDAMLEAGVGGAVGGGIMHGAGRAADAGWAVARAPGNTLSGVVEAGKDAAATVGQKARDLASSASETARAGMDAAKGAVQNAGLDDPAARVKGIYDEGTKYAGEVWDRIASGDDIADVWAKAKGVTDPERLKSMLPQIDEERIKTVREWGEGMLAKAELTPERKEWITQHLNNVADKTSQQALAQYKKGAESADRLAKFVEEGVSEYAPKAKAAVTKAATEFGNYSKGVYDKLAPKGEAALDEAINTLGQKFREQSPNAKKEALKVAAEARRAWKQHAPKGKAAVEAFGRDMQALFEKYSGEADPVKKSEDFSGIHKAIADEVFPLLDEVSPALIDRPDLRDKTAKMLRMIVESYAEGGKEAITSTKVAKLIDHFGDQTANIVDAVGRVMNLDPAKSEKVYEALNELRAQEKDTDKVLGLMSRSLKPELQESVTMPQLRKELQTLREWVATPGRETQRGMFYHQGLMKELEGRYGDKAQAVLDALEKEYEKASRKNVMDPDADRIEDVDGNTRKKSAAEKLGEEMARRDEDTAKNIRSALGDSIYYPPEKGGLSLNPDLDPAGDKGQAKQALERAKLQNPDRTARFVSAKELGDNHPDVVAKVNELMEDFVTAGKSVEEAEYLAKKSVESYGLVAAEGKNEPGAVTRNNIRRVMIANVEGEKAKTSHANKPSVFKIGKINYDAIALTKMMEEQFKGEYEGADSKGKQERTGRMFMTGVAALTDYLRGGKEGAQANINIPDSLVISHDGTTFGDIKGLDYTPGIKGEGGEPLSASQLNDRLRKLRNDYLTELRKGAKAKPARLDRMKEYAEKLQTDIEYATESENIARLLETNGQYEADPKGPIKLLGDKVTPITTNETANSREVDQGFGRLTDPDVKQKAQSAFPALQTKFEKLVASDNAIARNVASKGLELLANVHVLDTRAVQALTAMVQAKKVNEIGPAINAMHGKFEAKFTFMPDTELIGGRKSVLESSLDKPAAPAAQDSTDIDAAFAGENYPAFKTKQEVDSFLLRARKRFDELRKADDDLDPQTENAYLTMRRMFGPKSNEDLGSFYDGVADVSDEDVRAMLAAPEVAAGAPKASLQSTGTQRVTAADRAAIRAYIDKTLGPTVKAALANIPHAGEYVNDTIRISVHALNPTSVAHHEALHAFFDKLMKQGNSDVIEALQKAALSHEVQTQLKTLLKTEPAALAQLKDPEESAAYMYQFWAAGVLDVNPKVDGFFAKIAKMIRDVLGIWTQSERAEQILEYFHSGEFKTNGLGKPNAVTRALVESGRNSVIDRARSLTDPIMTLGEKVASAGGERLRSTGIPALRELADLMKATGREATDDPGFIHAARAERARILNELAEKLRPYTEAELQEALVAMQSGSLAQSANARMVQRELQKGPAGGGKPFFEQMRDYMDAAGVDVSGFKANPNYFPRKYDPIAVADNQKQFEQMLVNYGLTRKEAKDITGRLMATDGADFLGEVDQPGMVFLKGRKLNIPDVELEPYMSKDFWEIMNSYVSQATRRGEWVRRFKKDGEYIGELLTLAEKQGASKDDIDAAQKFVRAVDGTLGDGLNPQARRIMGNMVVYQNVRLLPLAVFSSVVDPLGIMVRGGTIRDAWDTFKRGISETVHVFKKVYPADADTKLAEAIGTIDDAMLTHTVSGLYTQGMVGDTARKINDAFFRYNLMEGFNRSMRVGATQAAIKFIERHNTNPTKHSERWLAEIGLKPGDWKGDPMDPKIMAAINQWVDGAVLRPDAADKPIWMNDPHWMLISHLKQFAFAFQETILKRVVHEYKNGNYAPAMVITSYVPVMIAADLVKALIQGGGELPEWKKGWTTSEFIMAGVERAGLYGTGQFAIDGAGMLMGPTLQQAYDAMQVMDGKASGSKLALDATPVVGAFY